MLFPQLILIKTSLRGCGGGGDAYGVCCSMFNEVWISNVVGVLCIMMYGVSQTGYVMLFDISNQNSNFALKLIFLLFPTLTLTFMVFTNS